MPDSVFNSVPANARKLTVSTTGSGNDGDTVLLFFVKWGAVGQPDSDRGGQYNRVQEGYW